ncbi:adenylylsulfate kinase [Agrobacterium rosae]|nr:adenylylsulfate kinase [Agrobacterium rosae]
MGLPGAGKTTLAKALATRLRAVHFNADEVRANISKDLGFSLPDRVENARRMGWLCDRVIEAGGWAIADFVCPTKETRDAFGATFLVFVDRVNTGRYQDTNELFTPPIQPNIIVSKDGSAELWAEIIANMLSTKKDFEAFHQKPDRAA